MGVRDMDECTARLAVAAMQALVPDGVVLVGGDPGSADGELFPDEERAVEGAIARRRREFRAGRVFARHALRELGQPACPLPVGRSRAPVWPDGFVGSIAHCNELCVVAVARTTSVAGLGIDVESAGALDADLVPRVCLDEELSDRFAVESRLGVDLPKVLFVAKESFYKAYRPATGRALDFRDVAVTVDPVAATFSARVVARDRPAGGDIALVGRIGLIADLVFCYVDLGA